MWRKARGPLVGTLREGVARKGRCRKELWHEGGRCVHIGHCAGATATSSLGRRGRRAGVGVRGKKALHAPDSAPPAARVSGWGQNPPGRRLTRAKVDKGSGCLPLSSQVTRYALQAGMQLPDAGTALLSFDCQLSVVGPIDRGLD